MICRECKKEIKTEDIKASVSRHPNWDFKETFICKDCFDGLDFVLCKACCDFVPKNKSTIFHDNVVCDECSNIISFCDNCKKIAYKYDTIYNDTISGLICRDCFSELKCCFCEQCGNVINGGTQCCEPMSYKKDEVLPYNYRPEPIFFKLSKKNKDLFLGIELEVGGTDSPDKVKDFITKDYGKLFYFKYDGSIPAYGCEIVTHPATLEFHKSKSSMWKMLLKEAVKSGMRGFEYKDCGIHVHVSRSYFNSDDLAKIDLFVNNYERFFRKMARRHTTYANFDKNKQKVLLGKFNGRRFSSVNFANDKTIEFRIFRSTMKYSSLMATIELTHSVCNFVKENGFDSFIEEKNETILNFIKYSCYCKYKYLMDFFVENKIIEIKDNEIILNDSLIER